MAENTPESDIGSIECFQNYTAPEVFIQGLAGIVDQQDVESMIRAQKQMLQRFEKTNEMLLNCNSLSVNRLKVASNEFKKHTQLLVETRKDLDNIFKRIRTLKNKLGNQYPQAFAAASQNILKEEEDDEEGGGAAAASLGKPKLSKSAEVVSLVQQHQQQSTDGAATGPDANTAKSSGDKPKEDGDDAGSTTSPIHRANSSSDDSLNGNSNNDSSPYTSDTG